MNSVNNLNNKYGVSNLCPAIMNDGRGVNTEYRSNRLLTQELKDQFNSSSSEEFRTKLQSLPKPPMPNISCNPSPSGDINYDKEIKLGQNTTGSLQDFFKPIIYK